MGPLKYRGNISDKAPVMINFMCQIDWAIGCPDIWPNAILDVSGGIFG